MEIKQVTVKEFASVQSIDPNQANTILQAGVKSGQAKIVGVRKADGAKGKGANIFEVGESIAFICNGIKQVTVKEFASIQSIDPMQANSILQAGVKTGQAKIVGVRKADGAKGKGANIFEINSPILFKS